MVHNCFFEWKMIFLHFQKMAIKRDAKYSYSIKRKLYSVYISVVYQCYCTHAKKMGEYKSSSSTITNKLEISLKTCPVNNVTIFIDRAEVNRLVDVDLGEENVEILLKDIPENIDPDSIRYV